MILVVVEVAVLVVVQLWRLVLGVAQLSSCLVAVLVMAEVEEEEKVEACQPQQGWSVE